MNTDSLILDRVKFVYTWVLAIENKHSRTISNRQLIIYDDYRVAFEKDSPDEYTESIAEGLFLSSNYAQATCNWFKSATPLALKTSQSLKFYRETLANQSIQSKIR